MLSARAKYASFGVDKSPSTVKGGIPSNVTALGYKVITLIHSVLKPTACRLAMNESASASERARNIFCGESPAMKKGTLFWSTKYRWFALTVSGKTAVGSRGSVRGLNWVVVERFAASTRLPKMHSIETSSKPRNPRIVPPNSPLPTASTAIKATGSLQSSGPIGETLWQILGVATSVRRRLSFSRNEGERWKLGREGLTSFSRWAT